MWAFSLCLVQSWNRERKEVTVFTIKPWSSIASSRFSLLPLASVGLELGRKMKGGMGQVYSGEGAADPYSNGMEMHVGVLTVGPFVHSPLHGPTQKPSLAWTLPSAWWLLQLHQAFQSEAHFHFFPPCLCKKSLKWFKPSCIPGVPWPRKALCLPGPPTSLSCSTIKKMPNLLTQGLL